MKFITISGDSMLPTLRPEDVIVCKDFQAKEIRYNKIMAFKFLDKLLVKRLVGKPGDSLKIQNQQIFVDDQLVFTYDTKYTNLTQFYQSSIPENEVFLIGDNPNNSLDSRKIGTIDIEAIKYTAKFRIWPPTRL